MAEKEKSLFQRLTRIFRTGPVVKRKIAGKASSAKSSAVELFKRAHSDIYNSTLSAYGAFDRMARYSDFCLTGDTLIATNTEEGVIAIKDIVNKFENGETVYVFSYNKETDSTVLAPVENAWQTVEDEIYEITFDDGSTIRCTGNHPIMLRNGEYCRTDEIQPNTAVMPFYRKQFESKVTKGNYRWIYGFSRGWKPEHVLIAEYSNNRLIKKLDGLHVHHKNFIKEDNRIENLELMDAKEHLAMHARINNKRFEDPKEREKQSAYMSLRWSETGDLRKNQKKNLKKTKLTDGYRKNVAATILRNKTNPPGIGNKSRKDQKRLQNANADRTLNFQVICNVYNKKDTLKSLSDKLNVSTGKIRKRLQWKGYQTFSDFKENYVNHKIISVVNTGVPEPVYDITVTKTHNFAVCDSNTRKGICFVSNSEMEATPELASALDIYSEETVSSDENGRVLHIYSEDPQKQELLNTLFHDTLNVEFNLVMWVRNLVKYGDFFLFNDIHPEYGVINAYPIPITEIEREEGFDPDNPAAVRFRWITQGNTILENWQITHFRLLANDAFLPYGTSVLESARRIWRQLILIEDAMLVYRIIRAPERRVFYIDVGNVPPEDVASYVEQAKSSLKKSVVASSSTGQADLRYNPMAVDEDYYIPVRGGDSGTKIDTLAGGTNATAIEDVEYIQKKLFAAIKIPKAYLGYDEDIGAKATLAQEDIRFSRSIQRIQKTVISELNKLAMIHLYSHGYDAEELLDFDLRLSNPSSVAQLQKLELISMRFDIAGKVPEGMLNRGWVRKNVLGLTEEDIEGITEGLKQDKLDDAEIEAAGGEAGGEDGGDTGDEEEGGGLFAADQGDDSKLLDGMPIDPSSEPSKFNEIDDDDEEEEDLLLSIDDDDAPVKAQARMKNVWGQDMKKKSDKKTAASHHMPNFGNMTMNKRSQDSMRKPYGSKSLTSFEAFEREIDKKVENSGNSPSMSPGILSILRNIDNSRLFNSKKLILNELSDSIEPDVDEGSS